MTALRTIAISCPDTRGIVHAVTGRLLEAGANIVNLQEHAEGGRFFMRIAWEGELPAEEFRDLTERFGMDIRLEGERRPKVGLFCSRERHVLFDTLTRHSNGELPCDIAFVVSNFQDLEEWVGKFGIPFYHTPSAPGSLAHEDRQLEILQEHRVDLIGLARYMKVLSPRWIREAGSRIINVHHSFLPSFVGAKPYEEAYERGVKLIGATSHYVTDELDQGPIIQQEVRRISHVQDIEHMKVLGRESECAVFAFALKKHLENKVIWYQNRTVVFD